MRFGIRLKLLLLLTLCGTAVRAQELVEIVDGLSNPLFLTHSGDGSGRLFIVEQTGRIRILQDGQLLSTPFLDVSSRIFTDGSDERGLLGLAFDPGFSTNRRFYIYYFAAGVPRTILARYQASASDPNRAEVSETGLLTISQPFGNHNGGMLAFGPDGFLYLASGDGGSGNDPLDAGQDLETLLGKILRLDVSGNSLAIPPTNPFVGLPGRDEIWAFGLRNPWRISFDRDTGRLFAADVGQNAREEINIVNGGENFGWKIMEGSICRPPTSGCDMTGLTLPIHDYDHSIGMSITGGYVYRGSRFPDLQGRYLFGDFISQRIWTLTETGGGSFVRADLFTNTGIFIASFGEDENGELYVVDLAGRILALDGAGSGGPDLTVDKSHSGVFRAGLDESYQIVVSNLGLTPTTGAVTLVDELPSGLEFVSAQGDGWSCLSQGQTVTCTLSGALGGGEQSSIVLQVAVDETAVPSVINSVQVSGGGDVDPANNSDTDPTQVVGTPDLALEKTAQGDFVVGSQASYALAVENIGSGVASRELRVRDELPAGLTPVSTNAPAWTCVINGQVVTCEPLLDIQPGQIRSIEIIVNIGLEAFPEVVNRATVTLVADPNPNNDEAEISTSVNIPPALDTDADGVSDLDELAGPDGGDANRDGVLDGQQSNVATFRDGDGRFMTLAAATGLELQDVAVVDNPAPQEAPPVVFPLGFFSFRLAGLAPGAATVVDLLTPGRDRLNSYFRFGPTPQETSPHWYEFLFDDETGARVGTHVIHLHFVDGGRGDDDLQANGVISDAGGAAIDPVGTRVSYLPQFADGVVGDILFQTSAAFLNVGPDTVLNLGFFGQDSTPMIVELEGLGEPGSAFSIPMASGASLGTGTTGAGQSGLGGLLVGYARIEAGPGLGGTLIFRRTDIPSGLVLFEMGVPATATVTDFTIRVDSLGDRATGLAIVNPPEGPVSEPSAVTAALVTLTLYDSQFNLLGQAQFSLADGEHRSAFPNEIFDVDDVPQLLEMEGTITVQSDRPLSVITIRTKDGPLGFPAEVPTLTSFPVVPGRADLPQPAQPSKRRERR